jgi:hypothetical protein
MGKWLVGGVGIVVRGGAWEDVGRRHFGRSYWCCLSWACSNRLLPSAWLLSVAGLIVSLMLKQ